MDGKNEEQEKVEASFPGEHSSMSAYSISVLSLHGNETGKCNAAVKAIKKIFRVSILSLYVVQVSYVQRCR